MKHFSVRPATTLRGRTFKGLRGWAGKPLHPPLTDIPIGAYIITAVLDVISIVAKNESWARDVFRASTFVLAIGVVAALPTALSGFWDWLRSTESGTQVRREANAHALVMILVTVLAITNLALRTLAYGDDSHSGVVVVVLSLVTAALTILGGTLGGSLVFDYGFNVETAGDHPAYHQSEVDVRPGERTSA